MVNQFNPSPIRQPVSLPLANPTWWLLSPHQVPNQNSLPNQGSVPNSLQSASNISHPPYQYSPPFIITIIQPSKGISASPQDPQAAIASPQTIPTTVAPPQLPQGTNPQPYTLQVMYQPIPLPQVVYQAPQYNPASLFAPPVVYYLPPPSMVAEPTVLSPANRNQGLAGHRNTVSTSGSSTPPKNPGGSSAPQTSSFASKIRNSSLRAPASTRTSDRSTPAPASKGRGNQGNSATSFRNVFLSQLLQPAAQQMARASGVAQYYEAHGCLDPPAVHALALTRGCTSSHAQRACEAIGHVGAEGMAHSPALSHLMTVMFPPVTSARLEACLSMTTIRQVTTQAMKSGRMGFSPLSTMIRTLTERMRARTRAVPSGNSSTHNASVGFTGQARGQDDVCEHVVSMLAMRAGVTPTSLEGIMEAVRDLRRHTMPYKCQEGKVGAMPFRTCCPGHGELGSDLQSLLIYQD